MKLEDESQFMLWMQEKEADDEIIGLFLFACRAPANHRYQHNEVKEIIPVGFKDVNFGL